MDKDKLICLAREINTIHGVSEVRFFGSRQTGVSFHTGRPPSKKADWVVSVVINAGLPTGSIGKAMENHGALGKVELHIVHEGDLWEQRFGGIMNHDPILDAIVKGERL